MAPPGRNVIIARNELNVKRNDEAPEQKRGLQSTRSELFGVALARRRVGRTFLSVVLVLHFELTNCHIWLRLIQSIEHPCQLRGWVKAELRRPYLFYGSGITLES